MSLHTLPTRAPATPGIDARVFAGAGLSAAPIGGTALALDAAWHYRAPPAQPAAPALAPAVPEPVRTAAGAALGAQTPPWLAATLEHVGRGLVVVAALGRVVYANRLARQALEHDAHPLRVAAGVLHARHAKDGALLAEALEAAQRRSLRRLLELGRGGAATRGEPNEATEPVALAVLPLPPDALGPGTGGLALISLPLARRSRDLALESYARLCELTGAETGVLEALAAGDSPADIAREKGVALCTVRTQICQLRLKTGCHSIRQLIQRVLGLPPMLGVVQ